MASSYLAKIYLLVVMLLMGAGNWDGGARLKPILGPCSRGSGVFAEAEIGLIHRHPGRGFHVCPTARGRRHQSGYLSRSLPHACVRNFRASRARLPRQPATDFNRNLQCGKQSFRPTAAAMTPDRKWFRVQPPMGRSDRIGRRPIGLPEPLSLGCGGRATWPVTFAAYPFSSCSAPIRKTGAMWPKTFWESFSAPDVLQHRAAAVLILGFAVFECAVQAGKLAGAWAAMIFPMMCGWEQPYSSPQPRPSDTTEDLLASMTHIPDCLAGRNRRVARLARAAASPRPRLQIAGFLWPLFLAAAAWSFWAIANLTVNCRSSPGALACFGNRFSDAPCPRPCTLATAIRAAPPQHNHSQHYSLQLDPNCRQPTFTGEETSI